MDKRTGSSLAVASTDDVVLGADGVPTSIRVFKAGSNLDVRGLDAVYDPADAQAILADNNRSDGKVPFDVAHGMVEGGSPEMHEAVGWGQLRCDDTGVWLDAIEWREDFKEKLRSRAYRYISPTFTVRQDEMKESEGKRAHVDGLLTVSLTNIPATSDIDPIVEGRTVRRSIVSIALGTRPIVTPKDKRMSNTDNKAVNRADDEEAKDAPTDKEKAPADDGDTKDREDGSTMDVSSIDLDGMNPDELKATAEQLIDMVMALQAKLADGGDSDEDAAEEYERQRAEMLDTMFRDRLIKTYAEKRSMKHFTLKQLKAFDAQQRAGQPVKRSIAGTKRVAPAMGDRIDEPTHDPKNLEHDDETARTERRAAIAKRFGLTDDLVARTVQSIIRDARTVNSLGAK